MRNLNPVLHLCMQAIAATFVMSQAQAQYRLISTGETVHELSHLLTPAELQACLVLSGLVLPCLVCHMPSLSCCADTSSDCGMRQVQVPDCHMAPDSGQLKTKIVVLHALHALLAGCVCDKQACSSSSTPSLVTLSSDSYNAGFISAAC